MDALSFTKSEWEVRMQELGQPTYRAGQVLDWLFRRRVRDWGDMSNLPASIRQILSENFPTRRLEKVRETGSKDTTRKFLFRLADGQLIESVLIPASPALYGEASDRRTICISSQVGCAYGCKFCASGLDGWKRNLTAAEIVDQFLQVEAESGEKINNIVFMGMGEPMANYDNLLRAISILNAPWGVGIGARHMTVSTSGLAPRIRDLATQPLQVRLAISFHGATDEVRARIILSGAGAISESDVMLAKGAGSPILGFNVRASKQARELADREGVEIRYYAIIYDLVDDIKGVL
jgi:23S rRNA (adenine2503-C2)-methyltransferase